MLFPTLRKPTAIVAGLLAAAVVFVAWYVDVAWAAWLLAAGLGGAAALRAFLPEKHVLTARTTTFDVTVLLLLAAAIALLAPWGNAQLPS